MSLREIWKAEWGALNVWRRAAVLCLMSAGFWIFGAILMNVWEFIFPAIFSLQGLLFLLVLQPDETALTSLRAKVKR